MYAIMTGLMTVNILLPLQSLEINGSLAEQTKTEEEKAKIEQVEIKYEEISEKKSEYEIQMKVPIFSGINDTFFQLKLNHALKKEAKDQRSAFITEAMKASKELEEKEEDQKVRPHQLVEEAILKMNGEMVSVYRETYLYQGGAHGVTNSKTINFLNNDKVKLLTFTDIFKEDVEYKERINAIIRKEIEKRKQLGIQYFDGEEGFTSVSNEQNFYFEGPYLVILFNQNEIAPGAAGIPVFQIPIEEIKDLIKENVLEAVGKSFSS